MRRIMFSALLLAWISVYAVTASAQDNTGWLAPPQVDGEAVYIPFPVDITLNGDLTDWDLIQPIVVTRGPYTSGDPAENGSFTFRVAADYYFLYITMTMPDQVLVTGQHGLDYWNEDSLEFYINASRYLFPPGYTPGIFQVRIIPADIGNTDPAALTLTGAQVDSTPITGYVFKTADGWGFEAAVALEPLGLTPEHGREIGFQAQANGASVQDRDTKLIWSLADTNDTSWGNPDVFGVGVFFEVGRTDVPPYSVRHSARAPESEPELGILTFPVAVNQVGYLPNAPKYGMMAADAPDQTAPWQLVDAARGVTVLEGLTVPARSDAASGDWVMTADFSEWVEPGTYRLRMGEAESAPFDIAPDVYAPLTIDALRYFYLNRSGMPLEEAHAGQWARAAGHMTDAEITCWRGTDSDGREWPGCDYVLDGSGGWYDAGDYGKYVVNGGIALWTLHNLYELMPDAIPDGAANLPESGNGIPDVLDEARWHMDWMLRMQVPEGQPQAGMAFHKLHDRAWPAVPSMPPTEYDNDTDHASRASGRYVYGPTTAATLNLAATAAQCARIWAEFDPAFAARCLEAAEAAWIAARDYDEVLAGNTPGDGGGNYAEGSNREEFFWAAAELYITTGAQQYADYIHEQMVNHRLSLGLGGMWWGDTQALGMISLATVPNNFPVRESAAFKNLIIGAANTYLRQIELGGYRVPLALSDYVWGSNSSVMNHAILLALAYEFTADPAYLGGVMESMDYLLGRNPLSFSYITGYGDAYAQHPHHRFWGNQGRYPPPPPGALAGGPNASPAESDALQHAIMDSGPAKRYVDRIGSYSTNEVAINWNAPLTWVAAYLDQHTP